MFKFQRIFSTCSLPRKKEKMQEDLRDWFGKSKSKSGKHGWVQPDGSPCANEPEDKGKTPKCFSSQRLAKLNSMGKEGKKLIRSAVRRKRKEDKSQQKKSGGEKPTMVRTFTKPEDYKKYPSGDKQESFSIKEQKKQPDHEHSMIRSELETIRKAVDRLKSKMKGEGNVEAWVQSKITKAADYIDSAADYIDSGEHNVHGSMDEAKKDPCWKGYKQVGTKKKGNKEVPNCVPEAENKTKGPKMFGEDLKLVDKIILEMESEVLNEKNVPTNPSLWSKMKARAKAKFDVYPCVPLDSQAITKEGLKSYEELKVGEDILTYNIENDILEWNQIDNLHFYEQAPLKRIYKKTGFSIRATENHKWVVRSGNNYQNVSLVETKDIHKRMRLITCAELTDNSKNNLFESNWSKKDNWVEKVLSWNKEQREVYLASSIIYDGHDQGGSTKIKERHTFGFTQKNNDHFWAAILSAYLNGYYTSFYEKTDYISGATIIRNKKFHSTQNLIIEDDGVEDVWCPTTKNNTWVMVQNGLITITGNSAYANGWAAKEYKKAGGGWKSVSEEYEEEDEVCPYCGCDPCECEGVEIEEATRMPAKTGNLMYVMVTWRGKGYSMKVFFPQLKRPTRKEVEDKMQGVYPGSKVRHIEVIDMKPGEQFLQVSEAIDKDKMKCNKPKADPVGDSKTGKSHVVKACEGGKEEIIRFGQRGVKGSPARDGESEASKKRRGAFKDRHAKNIAKGKMSAAYWANKVKW